MEASSRQPERTAQGGTTETLEDVWQSILDSVRTSVRREQFETWFHRTALSEVADEHVEVVVHNRFTRDWLETYYRGVLQQAIDDKLGPHRELRFLVDPDRLPARPKTRPGDPSQAQATEGRTNGTANAPNGTADPVPAYQLNAQSDVQLHDKYRFDTFVVGPCNRFAHAACVGVGEQPGKSYNPLFLHGSVGLGKTHLLQSLCHTILERDPSTEILFLSCETFVNHFISALEDGDLQAFRNKYRNVDVLVVDDIHVLANKVRTQEEFFHTFNTLYNSGKQIVLSSDSPPVDIPTLQDRLVSRFKWGLVTEIEKPCYETRMAILLRKSRERGNDLPEDVARLLAERLETNIRELEGAVNTVLGYARLSGQPITTALVRQCLPDLFVQRKGQLSIEDILTVVTEHFGVKVSELQSKRRTHAIAFPRQVAMYLARNITRMSLEEIGGFFGGRDHSTVLYGVGKIRDLANEDPDTRSMLNGLLNRLQDGQSS